MAQEQKHAALPWAVKEVPTSVGTCFRIGDAKMIEGSHGAIYVYNDRTSLNPHAEDVQQANARFVVTACNSHYEQLDKLKYASQFLDNLIEGRGTITKREAQDCKADIDAAIAKAEGNL